MGTTYLADDRVGSRAKPASAPYWERWTTRRSLVLHALLVAAVIAIYNLTAPETTLRIGGALIAPCFFFFAWLEGKKTFLKITPVSVYFIWQGFALGPAAIYAASQIAEGVPTYVGMHLALPAYLTKGFLIGLIGTLFIHGGLQWMRPKEGSPDALDTSNIKITRFIPTLLILFVVGCVVLAFGRQFASLGVLLGFFQFSGHAALLCFTLIPAKRLGIPEFAKVGILVLGTAMLALASSQSDSKLYLMLSLIGLLFYALQNKVLRARLPIMAGIFVFIYLSVVAPMVSGARVIRYKDKVPYMEALVEAFKLHSPIYTGRFDSEFYRGQMETLLSRQFEASSIAVIAEEVDLKGFINGETFYDIRYFFIPRLLWPDKPMVGRGSWFTSYLGNSARESDSTTSIGMEAAGELYWNFGYPGVVVGMFVLGAMFGGIWRMTGANPATQPLHMSLYMLNSLTMMNLPEAASRLASCIAIGLFFGTIFFLMRPRKTSAMMVFRREEFPGSI